MYKCLPNVFWRKKDDRAMRKKEYWANATRSGAVKLTKVGLRVTSSLLLEVKVIGMIDCLY